MSLFTDKKTEAQRLRNLSRSKLSALAQGVASVCTANCGAAVCQQDFLPYSGNGAVCSRLLAKTGLTFKLSSQVPNVRVVAVYV